MSTRHIYLNRLVLHTDGHINIYPRVVTGQKTFEDAVREQYRQLCRDVYADRNTELTKLDDSHWLMLVDGHKAFQFVYDGYEDSDQPGKIHKIPPPEETERSSLADRSERTTDLKVVFVKVAISKDGKTTRGHLLFHEPEGPKPMNWAREQFVKWVNTHFKVRWWHFRQGVMGRTYAEVKGGTVKYRGELHLAPQLQSYETPLWSFENEKERQTT